MFASHIFTLKNYLTFVLIPLIQTENINNKLITMTLKIRKSPALTLVLVVPPYFPPPLEKRKWKGEKKKKLYGQEKHFWSLCICRSLFYHENKKKY